MESKLTVTVNKQDIILTFEISNMLPGMVIDKVDFFSNDILIGTVNNAPYIYVWPNQPAGTYNQLTATARITQTLQVIEETPAATAVIEVAGLFANPQSIIKGQSVEISFVSPSADFHSVRINGVKPGKYVCDINNCRGSYTFYPQVTTVYTLTAVNSAGIKYPPMSVTVPVTDIVVPPTPPGPDPNPEIPDELKKLPRINPSRLNYLGAFRPPIIVGMDRFGYGCKAISYHNDSLWLTNHDWEQEIGQIGIPGLKITNNYNELPISELIQFPKDPTDNLLDLQAQGWRIGGTLIHKGRLYFSVYIFYDANISANFSHFISSIDLNDINDAKGPYKLNAPNPGFIGGYMSTIPEQWQPYMGAPCLSGQSSLSIISRSSLGPSAFGFDPELVGLTEITPTLPYVYYPIDNPTLGSWSNGLPSGQYGPPNPMWNMATRIHGVVQPKNSRSMLFFGRTGLGGTCYGATCYPGAGQSPHSEPYTYCFWEYDVLDLIDVKKGIKKPWEVIPIQYFFELPFSEGYMGEAMLTGVGYDPDRQTIYIGQDRMEQPIIHGFGVNV